MLYGVAQAGYNAPPDQGKNLTALIPGDSYTLFDGTETPSNGLASVAIVRGTAPGFTDAGITFYVTGGPAVSTTIDIQGSNIDADADYYTLATITPNASGNGAYTDQGRAAFYRAKISAYSSGAMPIVNVQR